MTLQARHLSSRLLLILALVAALLAGLVAIQWATSHSNLTHAFVSTPGGDSGGGRIRWAGVPGGDGGLGSIGILELLVPLALWVVTVAAGNNTLPLCAQFSPIVPLKSFH